MSECFFAVAILKAAMFADVAASISLSVAASTVSEEKEEQTVSDRKSRSNSVADKLNIKSPALTHMKAPASFGNFFRKKSSLLEADELHDSAALDSSFDSAVGGARAGASGEAPSTTLTEGQSPAWETPADAPTKATVAGTSKTREFDWF